MNVLNQIFKKVMRYSIPAKIVFGSHWALISAYRNWFLFQVS